MFLADKVIVISGVGPGLGRTLALEAADAGAKVVLGARNQEFLASVVADVEAAGGAAVAPTAPEAPLCPGAIPPTPTAAGPEMKA